MLGRTATVAGLACCVGLLTLNMLTGATAEQRTSQPEPRAPARVPVAASADQPTRSPRNANYAITARLDPSSRTLTGEQILTWRNTSSIPATTLRFHLYYNAWRNTRSKQSA